MKPGLDFIKYLDHYMMSSNTIGIRVSLGNNMCLCRCGLGFLNLK